MKLKVSTRIAGGFALVLGLSIITFLTAMVSLVEINGRIQSITEESMPTQTKGALLTKGVLEGNALLLRFFNSTSEEQMDAHKERFSELEKLTSQAQKELQALTANSPELAESLSQVSQGIAAYSKVGQEAALAHRASLELNSQVAELATEFTDMADEIQSISYDLEATATASSLSTIESIMEDLENTVSAASSVISTNIKFEVLSNRSLISSLVSGIGSKLNDISQQSELAGSTEVASMMEAFGRFEKSLVGESSLIKAKLDAIAQANLAKAELAKAQQLSDVSKQQLLAFNDLIAQKVGVIRDSTAGMVTTVQSVITTLAVIVELISVGVSLWVTRSIRVPLDNAVSNIKKVADGDLTVDFGTPSHDELGVMTSNMQALVNSLRSILHDIADSSNMLATTAEQTTAISSQSYDSVVKQKEQSHQVMSSIQEMADSVGSVSESINQTLVAVETAHDEAGEGDKLVKANISRIGNLAGAIESAASVISQLNEETGNIESVLEVIRGVAEQTNLLALNAAIEAARAGEQGRGFAVVADEVRTLASRTHASTEEIQDLIQRLLSNSREAVNSMSNSQEETKQCVDGINDVGSMLTSINGHIDNIKDMSQSIASAAEEQTASATEQTASVQSIVDLSEVTASSAEENREASQSLASMAEKQRALVGRFTV